jgi:ketosteroid isomerase-like protein
MSTQRLLQILYLLALLAFSNSSFANNGSAADQIRTRYDQFEVLFNNANADELTALYTNDAIIMPPGFDLIVGSDEIIEFWRVFSGPGLAVDFDVIDIEVRGNDATVISYYTFTSDGSTIPPFTEIGKVLVQWKRDKGQWKLRRDIWNVNP